MMTANEYETRRVSHEFYILIYIVVAQNFPVWGGAKW